MKKALLIIIKLGLFVLFLFNLGIFQGISFIMKNPAPSDYSYYKNDGDQEKERAWLQQKDERAQELGAQYGPENYFQDLADIELRKREQGFNKFLIHTVNGTLNNLQYIFNENLHRQRRGNDANYKAYMERLTAAQEEYFIKVDGKAPQKLTSKEVKEKVSRAALKALVWLLRQYLLNLLLGLALLWLWWYKEHKNWKINDPLNFALNVVIYPVVIIRGLRQELSYQSRFFILATEYRRRADKLWAHFSSQEVKEIKDLARAKTSLNDYRKLLDSRGLSIKHAWLSTALTVFCLLCVTPGHAHDTNIEKWGKSPPATSIIEAPPDIGTSSVNWDSQDNDYWQGPLYALPFSPTLVPPPLESEADSIIILNEGPAPGHKKRLKKVPLVVNNILSAKFKLLLIQKTTKNEKNYYNSRRFFNLCLES